MEQFDRVAHVLLGECCRDQLPHELMVAETSGEENSFGPVQQSHVVYTIDEVDCEEVQPGRC